MFNNGLGLYKLYMAFRQIVCGDPIKRLCGKDFPGDPWTVANCIENISAIPRSCIPLPFVNNARAPLMRLNERAHAHG